MAQLMAPLMQCSQDQNLPNGESSVRKLHKDTDVVSRAKDETDLNQAECRPTSNTHQ